jgi:DNA-binding NtrC family response regulator
MSHNGRQRDPRLYTDTRTTGLQDAARSLRPRTPGLVILCHPDPRRIGERVALPQLASGSTVPLSRLEPVFASPGGEGDPAPLAEPHLSRRPFFLGPGPEAGAVGLDPAGSRTRVTAGGEPVGGRRVFSSAEVERGVVLLLSDRIALLLQPIDPLPDVVPHFGLVGESEATVQLRREVLAAAELEVPVLIRGETGTGKELVARGIHGAGSRSDRPYLAVNMGALVPSLAASELFGALRGAYTGADRRKEGFFQSAEGGTLFLDEIGEAPPEVQVLLLRALENHEIQPVGSVETRKIDVRVIAATDADLEAASAEGGFRRSLLHRLAGYEIRVPPLRERRDDVARLLFHFLRQELDPGELAASPEGTPWPPAEVVARLVEYRWPGNVRQLRNVARRLAVARRAGRPDELGPLVEGLLHEPIADHRTPGGEPPEAGFTEAGSPAGSGGFFRRFRKPAEVSEEELLAALEKHRWQPRPTARALGVSRGTLYRLIDDCPELRKATELGEGEIGEALARCGGDPEAAAAELRVSPQGLKRRMTALGIDP